MADERLHLAIIPDGNRRWARSQGFLAWKGHEKAMGIFEDIIKWCEKHERIGTLTLWCFSTENWKRDKAEIDKLMDLLESYLTKERANLKERDIRLVHTGRKDRLPASIVKLLTDVEEETRDGKRLNLNIALDHGGKDEVIRAIRKIGDVKNIDEASVRANLDHPEIPDIDVVIRTSGEYRTSNFAIWQGAYAEWIFLQKHFPELTPADLDSALAEFDNRKRRYGG